MKFRAITGNSASSGQVAGKHQGRRERASGSPIVVRVAVDDRESFGRIEGAGGQVVLRDLEQGSLGSEHAGPGHGRAEQDSGGTAAAPGKGEVAHIDVRGLEPPAPMLAILELLERAGCGAEVIVHHEREPLYLYPELAERGWRSELIEGEAGEVRLRLSRAVP